MVAAVASERQAAKAMGAAEVAAAVAAAVAKVVEAVGAWAAAL